MPNHLIHIGFYKAGSTFLQQWFAQHPQLHYEAGAIAGFRDVFQIARVLEPTCKYYVTSAEELTAPHKDAGELPLDPGRPGYSAAEPVQIRQAAVCRTLRDLFPGSRILFVTRGFRSLQISGYSEYLKAGGIRGVPAPRPPGYTGTESRGDPRVHRDFDYLVQLYAEAFGEENLIVLPYELLRDDERRFLALLEERLGLDHAEVKIGRPNPSLSPEEMYWYRVISSTVSAAALRLGDGAFTRIYGRYAKLTKGGRLKPIVRLLARMFPARKVTAADFHESVLLQWLGRAERLRDDPLYAPYAADYLWDLDANSGRGGASGATSVGEAASSVER